MVSRRSARRPARSPESRIYELGVTLPDGPLEVFRAAVANLPKGTEAERLIIQRVGQDMFRDRLVTYWEGRCALTGITDPAPLRASHIIAWKDCASQADRLDVHNGLLLSALWDAAFDRGLVTFDDEGIPQFSSKLSEKARAELALASANSAHQQTPRSPCLASNRSL